MQWIPSQFPPIWIGERNGIRSLRKGTAVKHRLFFDTNILLDVVLHREEFLEAAASAWALCETRKAKGFVSAISLNNVHYVAGKFIGKDNALAAVRLILNVFEVVPLDAAILREAANVPHRDFEDDIQLASALRCDADIILSRDAAHYPVGVLPILPPRDYLAGRS